MKTLINKTLLRTALLCGAITIAASSPAAQKTWTGGGADGNWNSTLNWSPAVAPVNGDSVLMTGATRRLNTNNIVGLVLSGIGYSSNAFQTAGNAISNTGGIFDTVGNNTNNLIFTLGGAQAFSNDVAGTFLVLGGTITNAGNRLSVGGAGTVVLGGIITGNGGLTVQGPGTNRLGGGTAIINIYNGSTVVEGGVLQMVNGTAIPNGAGRGDVTNNAFIDANGIAQTYNGLFGSGTIDNLAGTATYLQAIGANATNPAGVYDGTIQNTVGKLGITKNNTNTFTLNGNGAYTGPTTINAGSFILGPAATLSGSTPITVTPGAVFNVSAQAGGFPLGALQTLVAGRTTNGAPFDVAGSVSSGGILAPYKLGLPGTMIISNALSLTGGFLDFDLGNSITAGSGSNDLIMINGPLTLSGVTTLRMNPIVGALGVGNYTIISNLNATVTGDTNNLAVIAPRGVTAAFDTTTAPGSVLMSVSGTVAPAALVWSGTNGITTWDVATSASWLNVGVADSFQFLDSVLFNDTGVGAVTMDVAVTPTSTTFNNVLTNYTMGVAGLNFGAIGGTGPVTMNGAGMVIMNTANAYTGNTIVNRGTLVLGGYNTGTFVLNRVAYNEVTPADLVIGAGGVFLQGVQNSTHGNLFNNLSIKPGGSSLSMRNRQANETTYYYQFNNWLRDIGGTIDFNNIQTRPATVPCGVYITNTATANGIMGGWATIYEENWVVPINTVSAASLGTSNYLAYQTSLTPSGWGAVSNVSLAANPAANVNDSEINTLKLIASTVTINAGQTLKLASGGILVGTAASGNSAINGGLLKGATNADLIVHNHSLSRPLTIASSIADNGSASALTKAGQGTLILAGTNSYSGRTYIGGSILTGGAGSLPGQFPVGTLQVGAGGTIGDLGNSTVVTNFGILAFNRSDAVTYAGTIAGPGALTKLGTGTTTLTGGNTFSGTTTVSAGTLQVGNGGTTGSLGSTSNIVDNAQLSISRSDALAINVPISGSGSVANIAGGTLTLGAQNTYSGSTLVNAGTVALGAAGGISNSVSIQVASGAIFNSTAAGGITLSGGAIQQFISGVGTVNGNVASPTSTRISPATNATVGTLTFGNGLTFSGGTYNCDISTSVKDSIVVGGSLTLSSGVVALNITGTLTNGSYTLINYTGALSGSSSNLSISGFSQPGQVAVLSDATPNQIRLVVSTYVAKNLVWQGDGGANLWDVAAPNWTNLSGVVQSYAQFDNTIFNDTSANLGVNLSGALTPANVTVSAAVNAYTFQAGGQIASGVLNKTGVALLTVLTTNTSASGVNITAGTVQLGDGSLNNGSLGSGAVANSGTLVFNETGAETVANAISGIGTVVKQGAELVSLTGNNTMTGPINITAGALSVGVGASAGTLGTGAVTNDSVLIFNRSGSLSYSGGIYGTGVVSNSGPGTVTLGGSNAFGNFYIANGTVKAAQNEVVPDAANGSTGWLILDGGPTVAGLFDLNGFNETVNALSGVTGTVLGRVANNSGGPTNTLKFINLAGVTNTFSGQILDNTGAGGKVALLQSGQGGQMLNIIATAGNPFTGGTVISNGVLGVTTPYNGGGVAQVLNAAGVGFGTGPITICGGALSILYDANATPTYPSLLNSITIPTNCTGTVLMCPRGPLSAAISGAGNLVLGINFVRSDFNADMSAFTGRVTVSNNPAGANAGNDFRVLTATGIPNAPVNLLSNIVMSAFTAPAGGVPLGELSGTNCFIGTSSGSVAANWLVGGLNTSTNFGGNIGNANGIIKTGTGTWTLAGVNTYSGTTAVTNGILDFESDVSASTSSSSFDLRSTNAVLNVSKLTGGTLTLGAAQTLLGNGTIRGSVNASGGVIPGSGLGTLTVTNSITFGGTAAITLDLNRTNTPASNDMIAAASVISGGTLTVANLGPVLYTGDKFKLFSVPVTGPFAAVNLPVSDLDPATNVVTYVWTNKLEIDGTIEVLSGYVAPGPSVNTNATNIVFTSGGGNVTLSWPTDHIGWTLQTQTNSRALGLKTNWFNVPGSAATNLMVFPVNPTNPTVFFRMVYP